MFKVSDARKETAGEDALIRIFAWEYRFAAAIAEYLEGRTVQAGIHHRYNLHGNAAET